MGGFLLSLARSMASALAESILFLDGEEEEEEEDVTHMVLLLDLLFGEVECCVREHIDKEVMMGLCTASDDSCT